MPDLRDLHSDPELRDLIEDEETRLDQADRDRRHGPVVGEDFAVEAELIEPKIRRQYELQEAFDNG